jgi:adenylate cyclase
MFGYPDQAVKRSQEALTLAQELAYSNTLAAALVFAAWFYQLCRDGQRAKERAEAAITLSTEQGLPFWLAAGESCRGWLLAEQGQVEEGIAQIRRALAAYRATGAEVHWRIQSLVALAEVCLKAGRTEEGLSALAEAVDFMNSHEERWLEAEVYRIKGQLVLQSGVRSLESENPSTQHLAPNTQAEVDQEAEEYFFKAIEIAQKQQAKSLELRAVMSLVRLRQRQAMQSASRNTQHESRTKLDEAHKMLSELYHWFTEGFDTKDLQDAKALLDELSH